MTKLEAVKLANILMNYYKMPIAREGIFESYVVNKEGKDLLYIGAGALGLYIDIKSLEVVATIKRQVSTVEEFAPEQACTLTALSYEPEDYQD
tara:strand:+ start:807 stop:1085 length:279 start_codon:yes stop_codon:yes gene_type:complete